MENVEIDASELLNVYLNTNERSIHKFHEKINEDMLTKLILLVRAKAGEVWNEHFHRNIADFKPTNIHIDFTLRGSCAGRAYYLENYIRLNPVLFLNNPLDMIMQTLPHEISHIESYIRYGREGVNHGIRWKSVMSELRSIGVRITCCHSYEYAAEKGKRGKRGKK